VSLWDIYQHMQIRGVRVSQHAADMDALQRDHRQEERIDELEDRIDNLLLLTEALWELCSERLEISEADLDARVRTLLDRRNAARVAEPIRCSSCQAAVPRDMDRCQFCGTATGQSRDTRFR
jgi:LSD1 subclass zinc finger protein